MPPPPETRLSRASGLIVKRAGADAGLGSSAGAEQIGLLFTRSTNYLPTEKKKKNIDLETFYGLVR